MPTTRQLSLDKCREAASACACFNVRKTARAITAIYDETLRPTGLRSGQFALLLTIRLLGSATMQELAEAVWVERSALGRTVRPLERMNLVRIEPGPDRRTRWISLTPLGQRTLVDLYPAWQQAQKKVVSGLGDDRFPDFLRTISESFNRLKPLVANTGDESSD